MSESPQQPAAADDVAVALAGVGKMYKIFNSRFANLKDALGLPSARNKRFSEFWAVRGIDFELRRGQRIGIIGRNGAGKSTVLKLITQNTTPTEGTVRVVGQVQALLDTGGGLHPEFTGDENIDAALTFLGLSKHAIREARDDIAEFTELGRFLGQPFKTYSLGMQARLAFGIATTIRPEILIIDEVLGAGDAYFFSKSAARMRELMSSGAAVLLVSHALDQIVRFCDEVLWLDRGRIVMRGPSTEVVKAYEKFIRELEDRRLQAKNRKSARASFDAFERDSYTDHFRVEPTVTTGSADIAELILLRDGVVEDRIEIGNAQDANTGQSSFVQLEGYQWTAPRDDGDSVFYRSLVASDSPVSTARGIAIFYAWFLYPQSEYVLEVRYRSSNLWSLAFGAGGRIDVTTDIPASDAWTTARVPLPRRLTTGDETADTSVSSAALARVSRWEGIGELRMEDVELLDERDREQAVFEVEHPLTVKVRIVADHPGEYPLHLAALIFRLDGIVVTRHISERLLVEVDKAPTAFTARLNLGRLQIGNGNYILSLGLYKHLDREDIEPSQFYDYFDKSFEFQVVGNPPLHNELVRHSGEWTFAKESVGEQRPPARVTNR